MERIRAISIRQPWAELILSGKKTIEIRSWATDYRGLLWLHTGLASSPDLEKHFGFSDLFKGGYVGSIVLGAITQLDRHRWEIWKVKHLAPSSYQPNQYAWLLSSPHRFDTPIPAKGQLGLFYPPIELDALLHQANLTMRDTASSQQVLK